MKQLLPSLLLAAALAALCSCSRPPAAAPPTPKVTVVQPVLGTVTNWDEYPAHLEAVESVEIRPRVSGYIESIHFSEGAEVKAGDLLLVIDPKPYQAELNRAQAQRQAAETRLALASNDLERAESLRGTKAISLEELDTRNKAVREATSGVGAARAAEEVARLNLEYTRITAPVSGKIGRRMITVGNLVQMQTGPGASVLATIVSLDPIYCSFDVEEGTFQNYWNNRVAQSADLPSAGGNGARMVNPQGEGGARIFNPQGGALERASLPCELGLAGEQGFPHKGQIDFFDNQVNPRTGTIRLRGVWANADRRLMPGMSARVRVPAGPPSPAVLIPAVAVSTDQGIKLVMVVNNQSQIERRPIKIGRQHGSMIAVLDGLKPEDRVVVSSLIMTRPGTKVEVVTPSPATNSSPQPVQR